MTEFILELLVVLCLLVLFFIGCPLNLSMTIHHQILLRGSVCLILHGPVFPLLLEGVG